MRSTLNSTTVSVVGVGIILMLALAPMAGAQLGEIAGALSFQVQVGHNETLQWHLLNEGSTPVGVQILPPATLRVISNTMQAQNQTTPTLYIYPMNLTVPPHGVATVNVTIFMPLNDTPNLTTWQAIMGAQETTNQSNPGGALILAGVAKEFSATAIPSTTTTSTVAPTTIAISQPAPQGSVLIAPIAIVLLLIVASGAYYYYMKKGKKATRKKATRARKGRKRRKARKAAKKKKAASRKRARRRRR